MKTKIFKVATAAVLMASFFFIGPATNPQEVEAAPALIVYNIYATDGYQLLADGSSIYTYGYIGGRQGQPMTYLNNTDQSPITLPAGPPAPTAGPIVPGSIEAQFQGNAQIPGPMIYARTGDIIQINFKNLGIANPLAPNDPHTIHLHGVDVNTANDGVPETSLAAVPANDLASPGAGNIIVYQFTTNVPGTYLYHCHQEPDIHVQMGMYGTLVIYNQFDAAANFGPGQGKGGNLYGFNYDKDYVLQLSDIDVPMHASEAGTGPLHNPVDFYPTYWTIDGLSFPNTIHAAIGGPAFNWTNWIAAHPGYDPFPTGSASAKTKVLVRLINIGSQEQPMHVHGFHPKVIGKDQRAWNWSNPPGMPTGKGLEMNTITISSGETYELLFDFGTQAATGNYAAGTQSRYNVTDGSPQLNTATAFPVIPDPFSADYPYYGGPAVPNLFPWHSHDDYKATNNGTYPGGMFTFLQVTP